MSYQQTVEPHHRETYADNIRMVAQQKQAPIRNAVTEVSCSGEAHSIADLVNAIEYLEAEDYSRTNPENVPGRDRGWLVRPTAIESGQYITKEEKFDQAMDPTSQLIQAHITAMTRGVQDRILGVRKKNDGTFEISGGGIMGQAVRGTTKAASNLPSGNYIAVDADNPGTPSGLGSEKLRAATEAMELEDFGLETEEEVYCALGPKQKTDLINLALATGTSLNPFEVDNIRAGRPTQLLGINWFFTNRLPKDSSGYRLNPIWTKSNIVLGIWQDVQGDMWNDTNAKNLPYVYTDAYMAAGRVEDGGVRVIRNLEA